MLRLAGAAAVGGLAASVTADPVVAADNPVLLDVANNAATVPTGIEVTVPVDPPAYGFGCHETGLGTPISDVGRPAVFGHATGTAFTAGVAGHNDANGGVGMIAVDTSFNSGFGLISESYFGTAIRAASNMGPAVDAHSNAGIGGVFSGLAGAVRIDPLVGVPPPDRATLNGANTFDADANHDVWFCYQGGLPGKWRKLAGPGTAGAFHPITPTRVYDSRAPEPSPGLLLAGDNRLVSVAHGRDSNGVVIVLDLVPAGATAVAANVTVTQTTSGGFLTVNPGGVTTVSASTINWFGAGQTLANGVTLTLNATRELTVVCGAGGNTHFIVDISGYYL